MRCRRALTASVEHVVAGALVLDGEVGIVGGHHLVVLVPVVCRHKQRGMVVSFCYLTRGMVVLILLSDEGNGSPHPAI